VSRAEVGVRYAAIRRAFKVRTPAACSSGQFTQASAARSRLWLQLLCTAFDSRRALARNRPEPASVAPSSSMHRFAEWRGAGARSTRARSGGPPAAPPRAIAGTARCASLPRRQQAQPHGSGGSPGSVRASRSGQRPVTLHAGTGDADINGKFHFA